MRAGLASLCMGKTRALHTGMKTECMPDSVREDAEACRWNRIKHVIDVFLVIFDRSAVVEHVINIPSRVRMVS